MTELLYLGAAVLFILGLKQLSSPRTARRGNMLASVGMLIAVVVTLANMDDIVNEWLDKHPDVYVKTVTSSIGTFEAKKKEPHMFVCIFY